MRHPQRLPKLEQSASASIAYGKLTKNFDRANVGVQREADHLCKVKFNSFTPETSAIAKVSQISSRQNNGRARERR